MRRAFFVISAITCVWSGSPAAEATYRVVPDWPVLEKANALGVCAGVGVDAQNRVYVFHRGSRKWQNPFPAEPIATPTVTVFEGASGKVIDTWGAGQFIMPHGLTIDAEGHLWLTDVGLHQVFKFTAEGKPLMTLGEKGKAGADEKHFNLPTDVAVLADGSFYVSDGYKNTRVIKFHADGRYDFEWGGKGKAEGQFNLPHGVAVDPQGRVYVCDRENLRLQVFDAKGRFVTLWQGPRIGKPYGAEFGPNGHLFVIDGGSASVRKEDRGKVVELDTSGNVVATFGRHGSGNGEFQLGHDVAAGPDGAVYVAEATGQRVQKFVRVPATRQ